MQQLPVQSSKMGRNRHQLSAPKHLSDTDQYLKLQMVRMVWYIHVKIDHIRAEEVIISACSAAPK